MHAHLVQLYRAIHAVIRRIPRGRVATYGQVAELAGIPGGARVAAAALKTSRPEHRLPWHRVIGKKGRTTGRIAIQDPIGGAVQRQLLEKEGVIVDERGSVALGTFGWLPVSSTASRARAARPRRPPRSASRNRASPSRR